MTQDAKWYVVHTYSGYENKVKVNIEKAIESRGLEEVILDIKVPMEEHVERKNGKDKVVMKKVFPSYVIIKMVMNDETWYVVRNTRGVTGFVGPASKPVPLTEQEIRDMGIENIIETIDFEVGDSVKVTSGPLENFIGVIEEINMEKRKIKALVSMFGRETPVELEFNQVEEIQ